MLKKKQFFKCVTLSSVGHLTAAHPAPLAKTPLGDLGLKSPNHRGLSALNPGNNHTLNPAINTDPHSQLKRVVLPIRNLGKAR